MSTFPSVVSESTSVVSADPFFPRQAADLILLIDDDDCIASIVERTLLRMKKRVVRARTGGEGAELFATHRSDISLIILDCGLPDINGITLCRAIRRQSPFLPIILTSGFEVDAAYQLAHDAHTVFLAKPFFVSEVQERVTALLGAIA